MQWYQDVANIKCLLQTKNAAGRFLMLMSKAGYFEMPSLLWLWWYLFFLSNLEKLQKQQIENIRALICCLGVG